MILQNLTQLLISDINNKMIEFTGSALNERELDELSYCSNDELIDLLYLIQKKDIIGFVV
jgi:hypothetical protein